MGLDLPPEESTGPGGNTVADEEPHGLQEFLIGPIDRRAVTQSTHKALDNPSDVFQAGVATEVELIVAKSELVASDAQKSSS